MKNYIDLLDANAYNEFFTQVQDQIVKYSSSLRKYIDLSEENPYYEYFTRVQDEILKYSKSCINKLEYYTGL